MPSKLLVLLAGALIGTAAHAKLVTFNYTAIVQTTQTNNVAVPSFAINGGWAPGDTLTGSFTLDLDTPYYYAFPGPPSDSYADYRGSTANVATVTNVHSGYKFTSRPDTAPYSSGFELTHAPGYGDRFKYSSATTETISGNSVGEDITLYLNDTNGDLLTSVAPPSELNFAAVEQTQLVYTWSVLSASDQSYRAVATLTSLQLAPVPEPATVGMLGAGLLLVAAQVRRRRAAG